MSDADAFKKEWESFRKGNPAIFQLLDFLNTVNAESSRGKVLICAGFLEEELKNVLLAFMLETPQATELVEGANAPLGTFSSRIAAAYALGLINADEHHDLTLIRKIRNEFAHRLDTSFDTPSVRSRCNELRKKIGLYTSGPVKITGPEAQFLSGAGGIVLGLAMRPHFVSEKRCKEEEWPHQSVSVPNSAQASAS